MIEEDPQISFVCSQCDERVEEFICSLPAFDYSAEVNSEGRGIEHLQVTCPECSKAYEVEITNFFDQFEASIPEEPNLSVSISVPDDPHDYDELDYDEYLKSYVPEEPWNRYIHSLELLDEMFVNAGSLHSYPMFRRMLLLQHIAMMEAYLCDRLITLAADKEVQVSLITQYDKLGDQKFPLKKLANNKDPLFEHAVTFLKNQLYHDLEVVDKLYTSALGATPFVDTDSKSFLKSVMITRHHCVHRDGKDNQGKVLLSIDNNYINSIREHILGLVQNIEKRFADKISSISSQKSSAPQIS
ncbi:hypothetical protein SAMN04488518_104337 [Pseudovibrio ascidiaceicola]|uniref:CpXC domain-containing protein n=1 Tax=Pseudovibrio ascidiaceicola TaxID=285279 RepID=A0A1I3Z1C1_9HYPH|nr:hypothetical protein [Pseudovibrio ascidiaceicola]SFK37419.1 hypothetical protein SAMN04488518_104337 [Pseudovibrio ascidiaceicola]